MTTVQIQILPMHARLLTLLSLLLLPSFLTAQQSGEPTGPVAIVNGVEIPYRLYENEKLNQMARRGLAPEDTSAFDQLADDGVFLTLVDAELTLQEGRRRGIEVGREEAIELLISNPPPYIRDIFAGQTYRPSTLRGLIEQPETIRPYIVDAGTGKADAARRVAQWKELTESLVRFYRVDETRKRLVDSIYAEDPLSAAEIRHRYIAENAILGGSVVRILHSTIPESEVPVSRDEARSWFREHIDAYAIPESRRPLAIILRADPTPSDSAELRRRVESVRARITGAPAAERTKVVAEVAAELPSSRIPPTEYIEPSRFGGPIMNDLAPAGPGDLLGPYPTDGETLMLYVAEARPSTDMLVRARHILLNSDVVVDPEERESFSPEEIDRAIRGLAADILDSIETEEDFARMANYYSQDYGSAGAGGDLGYASRGRYVPAFDSAVFNGPVGQVQGLIETQYGYHYIWVSDRAAREHRLRELRFPIEPSDSIRRALATAAETYAARLRQGEEAAQLIGEIRSAWPVIVDSLTFLKRLEPYADGLALGEFVFRHEEGDVGVVPLPFDRRAIVRIEAIWPGGVPRFEEIEAYPTAHARRARQLDLLEERQADLAGKIDPETLLGPLREYAPGAEVFLLQKQPIVAMDDEDPWLLDSLVAVTGEGEVSGPVRGTHAIYLIRLKQKIAPTEAQIVRDLPAYGDALRRQYRSDRFEDVLKDARAHATVVDLRESTRKVLGER